jgi:ABC-type bacteriocin/lantibiotic exporter with double-glycine peptidase domain
MPPLAGNRYESLARGLMGSAQMLGVFVLLARASLAASGSLEATSTSLDVPIVERTTERCGQAALGMVLRYYDAEPAVLREADRAYDPALRGSLITDLAAVARRAGYNAVIATLTPDSLIALLAAGVPPIVLYQSGRTPLTIGHYGVVTSWDPAHGDFTLNDGGAEPRVLSRETRDKAWRAAGSKALIIRRRSS